MMITLYNVARERTTRVVVEPFGMKLSHFLLKMMLKALVVEVMGGNAIIGKETIPLSRINTTPLDITLSLKNSKGKNAGTVNITFQLHIGSEDQLNAVLQVMKSQQAGKISSNLGGFSQPGQSPTIFRCGSSTSGGFQQPSTTAANRPIGGFNVVGNQVAGGAQSSTNRANFFTPNTIDSNSNGFQGDHIQHNVTERGPYIPQAGTGANGQRSFALHEPQPVYAAGHVLPFEPNNENSSLKGK